MHEAPIEFQTRDARWIVLRALKRNDIRAVTRYANTLVREKKTNADLGIVSLEKRVTEREERKFLNRIIAGRRTEDEISLAAFDGSKMIGHCHVSRRKQRDVRHTGVYGISILGEYRGVGIGTKITEEILRMASRKGVWLVELEAMRIN